MHSSHCWVLGTKPYCRQAKIPRSASVSGVCSTVSGMPSSILVSRSLVQQDKSNATDNGKVSFPASQSYQNKISQLCCNYNTFGNCGHFAPHGSFMLCAIFFEHSTVSSSSQSMSLASRPTLGGLASRHFRAGAGLRILAHGIRALHILCVINRSRAIVYNLGKFGRTVLSAVIAE